MSERAQLVLLAAAVVALAVLPVVAAYLQLGYHGDVDAAGARSAPVAAADRTLTRAVRRSARGLPAAYPWDDRTAAAAAFRDRLGPTLSALRDSRLAAAATVSYNNSTARRVAAAACPDGPDRTFGPCAASRGVVLQSRRNRTHVVAVAVDLRLVTGDGTTAATLVVRP